MKLEQKVTIEPAPQRRGWWIITYRDGIENRQAVTFEELEAMYKILKEFSWK